MQQEYQREPMLNDLCCLSVLGNVAYAIRCARRIQPRFQVPLEVPHAAMMMAIVDSAIGWAEEYTHTGAGDVQRAEQLAADTAGIANATCEQTDYAAFAAHHCVRAALLAAQASTQIDEGAFMEIVAGAFGSSRVLVAGVPSWFRILTLKSLHTDYQKLLELAATTGTQRGPLVDATAAGPLGALWQGPTPSW